MQKFPCTVKYGAAILHLIDAAQKPKLVAVIHCCGHQKETSQITQENIRADWEAKKASLMPIPGRNQHWENSTASYLASADK